MDLEDRVKELENQIGWMMNFFRVSQSKPYADFDDPNYPDGVIKTGADEVSIGEVYLSEKDIWRDKLD